MASSLKHCIFLLVAAIAVGIELNNAQFIPGARCVCHKTARYTSENITDFQIIQSGPSCAATQVIITVENSNNRTDALCLNPEGRLARAFIMCWDRVNRDDSKKVTCLNKRKKSPAKVTE
ncbi:unnamed protein product [Lota lota]